jgi:phosphoserine phosphatase RsbU/P
LGDCDRASPGDGVARDHLELKMPHDDVDSKLAALQALTDSALSSRNLGDLLVELLGRTTEILNADTAAVLVVDDSSSSLVARAAWGIEEEVRQNVRVPLGVGFAGRIAATKDAIRLDRVDTTTVFNPLLWERGIRVLLGVPLMAGADLVGVLHVGRLTDRPFSDADADLLRVVAHRVAAATEAANLAVERAAAEQLERSLLPGKLPHCPKIDFTARYVPAAGRMVGGDWYDAFTLPSERLWIVIGDVAGHALKAAVIMGRIKSSLRSFALLGLPPHEVLQLVDTKIDLFEMDTTVTIACATLSPPFDRMLLSIAGHPPPVIAPPNADPYFPDTNVGPLLGLGQNIQRASTEISLPPGSTTAFYTDGLIERRNQCLDIALERLRTTMFAGPSPQVTHHIMRRFIGNTEPEDDVALLVFHTT